MSRALSWFLPLATLAVYAALAGVAGARLSALSGGLLPFDLRVQGYGLAEARAYLAALPPEGVALYLGLVRGLDTAFPLLMGLTLMWWMRPLAGAFGAVCLAAALAYVALDLGENAVVAGLLRAGPFEVDPARVAAASALTQGKFAAFALALVLALRQIRRRRRQSGGIAQA